MLNSTSCPHPYLTFLLLLHQIMHVAYYLVQTVHMQYMLEAWGLSYPYCSFFYWYMEEGVQLESRPVTAIFGLHPLTSLARTLPWALAWYWYILWAGWVSSQRTILIMGMASVSETLVDLNHLMQLSAHNFIEFWCHKVSKHIHLMKQKTADTCSRVKYSKEYIQIQLYYDGGKHSYRVVIMKGYTPEVSQLSDP